jgi:hypothetical protein
MKTNNKHHHLIQGISLSLSMKELFNSHNDPLITSNYNFEGLVERKCLLKNYKKPNISKWKKYWVAICEHWMFFHKEKSFLLTFHMRFNRQKDNETISIKQSSPSNINMTLTENDRLYYRQKPSKCQSVTDCLIVLSQTKTRNEIQLSDLNRGKKNLIEFDDKKYPSFSGSMYKFRFENAAVANIWFQRLKEASTFKDNTGQLSENLIALD